MEKKEDLHSHHIFMLPFKYTNKEELLKEWGNPIKEEANYNQKAYFHKFFINSMFKNCEIYEKNEYKTFKLKTKDLKKHNSDEIRRVSSTYELEVEKISLRVFDDFNVGILSFHLNNKKYNEVQQILEINDYGRRIYPEYLDENNNCDLVPQLLDLDNISETFDSRNDDDSPKTSKIITHLIGDIIPAVDDRMFTISYFNNSKFSNEVKENFIINDKWYEYVFIDGDGKTIQNQSMQKDLISNASYARWKDYNTIYGMSKYSFVCLADSNFTLEHMKTIYFNMFSLLLMNRATLLKFSNDVSDITKDLKHKNTSTNITKLYESYIKFVNKYYFREITAKDQGLELYEQALNTLRIERDVKDLDSEIEELHRYVEMQQRKEAEKEAGRTNKKLNDISIYGGILLGVSVLTGFFGMNVGESENFSGWLVYPLLIASVYYGIKKYKGES